MSSRRSSKRASPVKNEEVVDAVEAKGSDEISPSKRIKSNSGLKLRLKVSSSGSGNGSESGILNNSNENNLEESSRSASNVVLKSSMSIPKIKLNFSGSNESSGEKRNEASVVEKEKGKRGRPKKDKSAVLAAAIAASQPNEAESEERKSRRRATEEKIKRSISMDSVMINVVQSNDELTGEENTEKKRRGRRPKNREDYEGGEDEIEGARRMRKSKSMMALSFGSSSSSNAGGANHHDEFVDITGSKLQSSHQNHPIYSAISASSPYENEFIQRSKTFLNISMQHEAFLFTSSIANPLDVAAFKSIEDAVDKLAPFHLGIHAGQFTREELSNDKREVAVDKQQLHSETFDKLQDRYRAFLQAQSSKKVATELLLLEQRLCLEEEKFLLVKLKNEYAVRFMRGNSNPSSRASTPSSTN